MTNHTILKPFIEADAIFENHVFFHKLSDILRSCQSIRPEKDRPVFSVHQQCPKVSKQVSISHLSLPVKNHIFWHEPHFSLIETQCHLKTTHLRIQPLDRNRIMQHLQHEGSQHHLKIWKFFLGLVNNTSPSQNSIIYYQFQKESRWYLPPLTLLS